MEANAFDIRNESPLQELSGHRPVVFDDRGEEDVLLPAAEMDVLLLCDNRIIASTARQGRYAAGGLFYARSPRQYTTLQQLCSQPTDGALLLRAVDHNDSLALCSGALLADTAMLLAVVLHGNVKRMRRVITHCFADVIAYPKRERSEGGLRRGDEPFSRGLCGVVRLLRRLLCGCHADMEITERGQLMAFIRQRMQDVLRFLPDIVLIDTDEEPGERHYPCLGTIRVSHAMASMLCFLLAAHDCYVHSSLRVMTAPENRYPQFVLTGDAPAQNVPRPDAHPAMLQASLLSLRGATQFACSAVDGAENVWQICFSPMRARYGELYTLRETVVGREDGNLRGFS